MKKKTPMVHLLLEGDPSTYPFDKYSIDLIYILPIKEVTFREGITEMFSFDESVNTSWDAYILPSKLDNVEPVFEKLDLYCKVSPYYKIKGFEAVGAPAYWILFIMTILQNLSQHVQRQE